MKYSVLHLTLFPREYDFLYNYVSQYSLYFQNARAPFLALLPHFSFRDSSLNTSLSELRLVHCQNTVTTIPFGHFWQ